MEGIKTPKIERALLRQFHQSREYVTGTLCLTDTHMIFIEPTGARETWLLYHHVHSMERLSLTTKGYPLIIETKTFRQLHLIIPRESDCLDVMDTIKTFSQPDSYRELYAYHYRPKPSENLGQSAGWALYDALSEYERMGVPNKYWKHTNLNSNYELSETYSGQLFVPATADDSTLIGSAKFRSKGRLPVLSYYYSPKETALCRSSQPLVGLMGRSVEDEQMVQAIVTANPNSDFIYVIDTRPKINAMANKAAGKGYESTVNYSNVVYEFYNIRNIHVMRESLQRLLEATFVHLQTGPSQFLSALESSGWMKHIHLIMEVSNFCATALSEKEVSVMVHCSDGWDRTAQTCALISLFLDPYYRSLHGFMILIEKEWLSFGHKFSIRNAHLSVDGREFSPILTQFLDCVWQTMIQFPTCFQFNEQFLVTLHDHVHSCQFGTFLGNCERERVQNRFSECTYSFWGYVWAHLDDFINPLYDPSSSKTILVPQTSIPHLRFWQGLYCRYNAWEQPSELVEEAMTSLYQQNDCLAEHIRFLQQHISQLKSTLTHFQDHHPELEVMKRTDKQLSEGKTVFPSSKGIPDSGLYLSSGDSLSLPPPTGNSTSHNPAATSKDIKGPPPSSSEGVSPLSLEDNDEDASMSLVDEIEDSLQYSITGSGVSFTKSNQTNRRSSGNSTTATVGASSNSNPGSEGSEEEVVLFNAEVVLSDSGSQERSARAEIDGGSKVVELMCKEVPTQGDGVDKSQCKEGGQTSPQKPDQLSNKTDVVTASLQKQAVTSECSTKEHASSVTDHSVHTQAQSLASCENGQERANTSEATDPSTVTKDSETDRLSEQQEKLAQSRLSPDSFDVFKDHLDHIPDMNLPWQPLRGARQCSCGVAFSFSVRKFHCSFCGVVVCSSCGSNHALLPWHVTTSKPQRVCKTCFKLMRSRLRDLEKKMSS